MVRIEERRGSDPEVLALVAEQQAYSAQHTPADSNTAYRASPDLLPPELRFFVALSDGAALGCIALLPCGEAAGEVKTMHVLAAHRGQGIADQLIQAAEAAARAAGMRELVLATHPTPGFAASRKLYARHGFSECGPFGGHRADPNLHFMRKAL